MRCVRIVADDLTGALDAACRFVGDVGPFHVAWRALQAVDGESFAVDTETREEADSARLAEAVALLRGASVDIAFKKIDSLLRGDTGAEIAAILTSRAFRSCVIAPAFPGQGRIMSGGRQLVRRADGRAWAPLPVDLAAELRARGMSLALARDASELGPEAGVYLCDAKTDAELRAIVAAARSLPGPLLWCGTAGLAGALAGVSPPTPRPLPRPLLAIVGSDHAVAQAQIARLRQAAPELVLAISAQGSAEARPRAGETLAARGFAALVPSIPTGSSRRSAACQAKRALAAVLEGLAPPGSVMVAGGETLRMVADILGARALRVEGEREPGVPVSAFVGGRWDGLPVLSKSGAFAGEDFLIRLHQSSDRV